MPFSFSTNDLFSVFYGLGGLRALARLIQNWKSFWDNDVTPADRALAGDLALFVLVPLGVLLHLLARALAIRFFGAEVTFFEWHVVWGIVGADQEFTRLQNWLIALSGNAVSVLLGLMVIPLLPFARRAIWGQLLYRFAWHELFYALVWFPVLSVLGFGGEWSTIYNFGLTPYAQIALGVHLALLAGLWGLNRSHWAARWRIGIDPEASAELQALLSTAQSATAEPLLALAYFYQAHGEDSLSRRYERQAEQSAPNDPALKPAQAYLAYNRKQYRQSQRAAQSALEASPPPDTRAHLHRILALSALALGERDEAMAQFEAALFLLPDDYDLHMGRGQLKRTLGRREEAGLDFQQAVRLATDDEGRAEAQRELERSRV